MSQTALSRSTLRDSIYGATLRQPTELATLYRPIAFDRRNRARDAEARRIGAAASAALLDELALYPKPGLVSFVDTGSHADMDARTFARSVAALRSYFVDAAGCGLRGAAFAELEALGVDAETAMRRATGGVNTHSGAIFCLGLLCAGAGAVAAHCAPCSADAVRAALRRHWGAALLARASQRAATARSKGAQAARLHGLRSASDEAALGFPVLFCHALPAWRAARQRGGSEREVRLHVFFRVLAELDDTNLAHRGGIDGLRFAQHAARLFLETEDNESGSAMDNESCGAMDNESGGAEDYAPRSAVARALAIHRSFVARRLSPGGAADMFAAACWFERIGALR
ncbi:MAG: triphosphoribosyl-dephospho-CoA synthase [Caldimonas sp.]